MKSSKTKTRRNGESKKRFRIVREVALKSAVLYESKVVAAFDADEARAKAEADFGRGWKIVDVCGRDVCSDIVEVQPVGKTGRGSNPARTGANPHHDDEGAVNGLFSEVSTVEPGRDCGLGARSAE